MPRKRKHGGRRPGAGRKKRYPNAAARAKAWRARQPKLENVRDEGQTEGEEQHPSRPQDEAYARAVFHGGKSVKERQDDQPDSKKRLGSQLAKITPQNRLDWDSESIGQVSEALAHGERISNLELSEVFKVTLGDVQQKIDELTHTIAEMDAQLDPAAARLRQIRARLEQRLRERKANRRAASSS